VMVLSSTSNSASFTSFVSKWRYFQSGKHEKLQGAKSETPCWKRKCETRHNAAASSLVAKVLDQAFTQLPWNIAVCRIGYFAYQAEFFVNSPLDVKENVEHSLDFALHLSHLFQSLWFCTFPFKHPCCLSNHCQGRHHI
jgi:hypothetical protein